MADERLMKYGKWLVDNADKKGTPEFETVAQAYRKLRGANAPEAAPDVSVGEDVARSVVQRGLPRGIAGVLGAPGDIYNLMQSGVGAAYEYGREKLLGPRTQEDQTARDADMANLQTGLTQEGMLKAYEGMGGELYNPKTTAGKYAATGTEFGVGGLVGGPRAAIQSGIAGLASEGAGQLTEGTAAEPYARAGAAILTGGGLALRDARKQASKVPSLEQQVSQLPTAEQTKQAARAGFKSARNLGLRVKQGKAQNELNTLAQNLTDDGLRPYNHPGATGVIKELDAVTQGGPVDFDELLSLREAANKAIKTDAKGALTPDGQFALRIQDSIDDMIDNLRPTDMVGQGDPVQAAAAIREARKAWGVAKRTQEIERLFDSAELASANYVNAGMETAIRQKFRQLADNPKRLKYFSAEERKAIRNVAMGGKLEKGLRAIGKYAPTSPLSAVTGMTAAGMIADSIVPGSGLPVGIATGTVGTAARSAAANRTLNNAKAAEYIVRSGGQLPQSRWPVIGQSLGRSALGTSGGLLASRPGGSR